MLITLFCPQVQKRFEALKKRKDPASFSEEGDTMRKHHLGCHFSSLFIVHRIVYQIAV
jgi:hypothetical protein